MFRLAVLPVLASAWQYHCPAGMEPSELDYDLHDKTFLVTGADGHIGFQVALAAAKKGAHVLAACRTEEKAAGTKAKLEQLSGGSVEALAMDLSSFASVRAGAAKVQAPVHSLVHVAGVNGLDHVTSDGFMGTVQVNVLSAALLTELLLPNLRAAEKPRVVYVGSGNQYDDMHFPQDSAEAVMRWSRGEEKAPVNFYSLSKLLDVHYAKEQALRHSDLTVFSLAPGFSRDPPDASQCPTQTLNFTPCPQSPAQAATSSLFAAAQPGIEDASGAMFDFETAHAKDDYFSWSQSGETCVPRELPRWDDAQRAQWYDAVQALLHPGQELV